MIPRILRAVGFIVFVTAFFLPAIRAAETQPGSGPQVGWVCALFATMATGGLVRSHMEGVHPEELLLVLSGWVNPLVLIYLMFCIWSRFVWVRRGLAAVIVLCFGATWLFFAKQGIIPMIGHYLWVAGALIMLSPEVMPTRMRADAAQPVAPAP